MLNKFDKKKEGVHDMNMVVVPVDNQSKVESKVESKVVGAAKIRAKSKEDTNVQIQSPGNVVDMSR
jgi:hypothetical protein